MHGAQENPRRLRFGGEPAPVWPNGQSERIEVKTSNAQQLHQAMTDRRSTDQREDCRHTVARGNVAPTLEADSGNSCAQLRAIPRAEILSRATFALLQDVGEELQRTTLGDMTTELHRCKDSALFKGKGTLSDPDGCKFLIISSLVLKLIARIYSDRLRHPMKGRQYFDATPFGFRRKRGRPESRD